MNIRITDQFDDADYRDRDETPRRDHPRGISPRRVERRATVKRNAERRAKYQSSEECSLLV